LLHTSSIFRTRAQAPCLDESFRQVTAENKLKQTKTFWKTDQPQAPDAQIDGGVLWNVVANC